MSATTLGGLREKAAPWLNRAAPAPLERTVDTADRADWAVWDQISHECRALARLDADLAEQYGTPGLAADLWIAAYAQDPQPREADTVTPAQRCTRAVTSAMLGTPEHDEMRASTVGDPYAAAMSVLALAPAVRKMLRELDPDEHQRKAQQARQEADAAADQVGNALQAAQDAAAESAGLPGGGTEGNGDDEAEGERDGSAEPDEAEGEPDGTAEPSDGDGAGTDELDGLPVPRPELVDVQRAITEAAAADADAERAEQAMAELGDGDENGDQAVMAVRSIARQACADATDALEAEATAMAAWGVEPGERQRMDPNERMKLAKKLQTGKLKEFAQLVGRFQQMAQAQRARRVEHARGEYVGVTLGDDLSSLISAELVNVAVPALRAQFAVRYAERQLMVYDQRGEENEGQGAVIVCIDCSDSMTLTDDHDISGEAYAKAFALALLEQARAAKPVREYVAILFSHVTDATIVFPADQPVKLADRVRLAQTFSAGGTFFVPPLNTALKLLEAEYNTTGKQRADVVFITDGASDLSEEWLKRWHEQKKRLGFRCFGIQIGWWSDEDATELLHGFCDDVRRIEDLADTHATADIFRAV